MEGGGRAGIAEGDVGNLTALARAGDVARVTSCIVCCGLEDDGAGRGADIVIELLDGREGLKAGVGCVAA